MPISLETLKVKLTFTEDLLGSWPADPEIFTRFVSSKAPSPWLQAEEQDSLPSRTMETGLTVFPEDEKGLFLYNYHLKGFLKEAGNTLKDGLGVKNLRSKIDNYVFIKPRKIYLTRNGQVVKEPDDIFERPLRGQTPQGPRVTLVGSERVKAPIEIRFTVEVIENKEVTVDLIREILNYGDFKGIGQWRNGGWGSFQWEEVKALSKTA